MRNRKHEPHLGQRRVAVGRFFVLAGGLQYLRDINAWPGSVLVPLTNNPLQYPGAQNKEIVPLHLPDFGGVTDDWEQRLKEDIIPMLATGREVMAFCFASHGRTGTFLASLIALLEPDVLDPIAATRERHCGHSVEVLAQAEAIFALRGQELPQQYVDEFAKKHQLTVK